MAIDISFQDIVDSDDVVAINANFDAIVVAFQEALSRSGTTPNQMEADLDLNSNTLLNSGGVSGTFASADNKTITVTNGIITSIV